MRRALAITLATVALIPVLLAASDFADLGSIDFPNSGSPEAQDAFLRGVLLLHSFEYEDARDAFRQAQEIDVDFALAYWGEAMTHNHPLWRQQDRDAALEALGRYAPTAGERAAKVATEREAAYLEALEVLYGEGEKVQRDLAYCEAMGALAELYPEDLEARAFYALSILGTAQAERDFATYMRAAAIAEEVFAANPRHPGAIHYMIHSYDDPIHAPLGLRAARVYNEIAPAASHAQHMISHIFVALGRWADSVESNINAFEVSKQRREAKGLPVDSLNYHALHWLEYSYLQLGQFDNARRVLDMMGDFVAESGSERAAWHYAAMRAMWNVETGGLDSPPPIAREVLALGGAAQDLFAEGYVAIRNGDGEAAKHALGELGERLEAAEAGAADDAGPYDAVNDGSMRYARVLEDSLAGLIAVHEGRVDEGLALFEQATAIEGALPLEYGPPDIVKPSHELYGEVLAGIGRPDAAATQFEIALGRAPLRTRSLLGLAAAAAAGDDAAQLASTCGELATNLAERDPEAPAAEVCAVAGDGVAP